MNAAIAIALALALLQLLAQVLRSLLVASDALRASQLLGPMVLVVFKLLFIEHIRPETARTLPARVSLKVLRMKPLCTAVFAYQLCVLRTRMMVTLRFRPVLQLIRRFTFAASQLRLALSAHQA